MLMIQKFIKENNDWRDKLSSAPFNLKIKEEDGFVLFKYDQINSDFNEKICREARGLILDSTNNFKVVRLAFERFFNLDESYAAHIDWNSAIATEKIDGSIMSVWFARGKWHLSTNGVIDAFKAELNSSGPYKTFGELFESVLPLSTFKNYNKHRCWTFELVSPYNKVVIDYPETKVYLLSVRDMNTLEELSLEAVETIAEACSLNVPQHYFLNNEMEFRRLVEQMPEGHEGIVVRDINGERVKIKTPLYFELHRMAGNGKMTLDRATELIKANDYQEFLVYFPQYENYFLIVKNRINYCNRLAKTIPHIVNVWKSHSNFNSEREAKKEFAFKVSSFPLKHLYFKAYNGDLESYLNSLTTNQWLKVFASEFKDLV